MVSVEDRVLRQRFAKGDHAAVRALYHRYGHRMLMAAMGVLGDRGLAADAVQQAFIQAWRACGNYDSEKPIGPWLMSITRRAAIDVYRKNADRDRHVPLDLQTMDVPQPPAANLEDAVLQRWRVAQVRSAVGRLSGSDQQVITLAFLEGRTHHEVASLLRIPMGTVKSRLFRAQRRLAAILAGVYDD